MLKQKRKAMTLIEKPTFQIVGKYKGGKTEDIDIAYGEDNKKYLLEEYKMALGDNWDIIAFRIDE